MNEIEQMLMEEIREKKRAGNGVHSKTGIRGYVGVMRTTVDLLKGTEKRKYKGNGRVVRYNMYDTVLKMEEFETRPDEEKIKLLTEWRKRFKNIEIAEGLGIHEWKVYELFKKYQVPTKIKQTTRRKYGTGKSANKGKAAQSTKVVETVSIPTEQIIEMIRTYGATPPHPREQEQVPVYVPAPETKKGFTMSFDNVMTGAQIADKILRLAQLLDGDPTKYRVCLMIEEQEEKTE